MNFNTMSVSKLTDLRRQVEAAIHAKIAERRHRIELELLKLTQLDGGRAKVVRTSATGPGVLKTSKPNKSTTTVSPDASIPRKTIKTRKARKKARKPETVSVASLQMAISAAPIATPSNDTPFPASISASEIPVDLGAAA
jgi:hypothetical protein